MALVLDDIDVPTQALPTASSGFMNGFGDSAELWNNDGCEIRLAKLHRSENRS